MILGVDYSKWQGRINPQKLINFGIAFAIVKCGEYLTYYDDPEFDDKYYDYNMYGLELVDLPHGSYYFYHPKAGNTKQLRHFERLWKANPHDFPPVLDVEAHDGLSPAEVARQIKVMLEGMEEISGRQPIIYTSPGFWNSYAYNPDWSDEYKFWVAQYPKLTTTIFKNVIMHQFTDKGAIPGCPTIDLNYWLGTEEELRELTEKEITIVQIAENRIKNKIFAISKINRQWLENQMR
jgi:lysozyme